MAIKKNPPLSLKTPPSILYWAIAGLIAVIAAVYVFISQQTTNPPIGEPPLSESPQMEDIPEPPAPDCGGRNAENTDACCQNWAVENGLAIPACLGRWTFSQKACSYICGVQE